MKEVSLGRPTWDGIMRARQTAVTHNHRNIVLLAQWPGVGVGGHGAGKVSLERETMLRRHPISTIRFRSTGDDDHCRCLCIHDETLMHPGHPYLGIVGRVVDGTKVPMGKQVGHRCKGIDVGLGHDARVLNVGNEQRSE